MGKLYAIQPFTMLDFPGEIACIAWFSGCNLRCVYCHNPDIVLGQGKKEGLELIDFLEKRKGRLTGVVFSGGEPTFAKDLYALAQKAKELGYKVKLDTNGSNPEVVEGLLKAGLLDYVALDYKSPPEKALAVIGSDQFLEPFSRTLDLLVAAAKGGLGFEVRTTCHPSFLDEADIGSIMRDLAARGYAGTYYIQAVVSTGDKTLGRVVEPERHLDTTKLPAVPFPVAYRNFKDDKAPEGSQAASA
jgi:pyruvate formate lyase activating enzyme